VTYDAGMPQSSVVAPAVLARATALASCAIGLSEPNPRVGCVIVVPDGTTIGEGHTQAAGGAHAEVMALRSAREAGHDPRGATVIVTLEPCSHHGRTPPCCDALIDAAVARVVVAVEDPNPLVAGQGIARLRAAGIAVDVVGDEWGDASRELNIGFFSRMTRGRPWVRMKIAASLDGRTALSNGVSRWITGDAARIDGHAWRKRGGAILTGVGTVLEDDPRLDVRLVDTAHQPLRVIVDSRLQSPPAARIFDPPGSVLIYAADEATAATREALQRRGAEIAFKPGAGGKVDLRAMLSDLAERGVNELHVEAGHKLNGSFVREALVDEFLIYLAPKLLGVGREIAAFGPLQALSEAVPLRFTRVEPIGDDLRIIARSMPP